MRRECRGRFHRHRGLAISTCITARASRTCRDACRGRSLAVSFEVSGGEDVSGIPGACATRNFSYLVRGPLVGHCIAIHVFEKLPIQCIWIIQNPSFRFCSIYRLEVSGSIELLKRLSGTFCFECASKIKSILSSVFHAIYGAVRIQLTHWSYDDCENMCTLSYDHIQTGSMTHLPLFSLRSWNNGMRCVSFYILINSVSIWIRIQYTNG